MMLGRLLHPIVIATTLVIPTSFGFGNANSLSVVQTGSETKPALWSVSERGQLIWEGTPTSLVGNRWLPQSLVSVGDEALQADEKYLDAVAKKGNSSVLLQLPPGGITVVQKPRLQRVIDLLESRNIRYGIALKARSSYTKPVAIVHPSRMRFSTSLGKEPVMLSLPMLRSCWTVTALPSGEIMDFARETVAGGSVEYQLRNPIEGNVVGIFIPEVESSDGYATLFSDSDSLRDDLMSALEGLRFGKNLRFFTDPFDLPVLSRIEDRRKVPTSDAFRTAWANYLKQKYTTLDGARISWRLDSTERVDNFDGLARLLPLSFDGRGVAGFIDPVGTGRLLKCESQPSVFWNDLAGFVDKLSSDIQDRTALALQRAGHNVPIISVNTVKGDHKGLGGVLVTSSSVIDSAPKLLDQSVSGKRIWNVVDVAATDSQAVQPTNWAAAGASSVFYPETNVDRISGGQITPADRTGIVPLPMDLSTRAKQLENGTWWLPDTRPMRLYRYPNGLIAYGISDGEQSSYYFVGTKRPSVVTIKLPKALEKAPISWFPVNAGIRSKGSLQLSVRDEPVLLKGFGNSLPVPFAAMTDALDESKKLVAELRKRNIPDAGRMQLELSKFDGRPDHENPQAMYSAVQTLLDANQKMIDMLRPFSFLYIEAEGMPNLRMTHTWDGIVSNQASSGGKVLHVSRNPLGKQDAIATYTLRVNAKTQFSTYYAATGKVRMRVDGKSLTGAGVSQSTSVGAPYGPNGLAWFSGGNIELVPGDHVIDFIADGECDLDAFMLSVDGTKPNGSDIPVPPLSVPNPK
jgi:hypothetical protein